MAGDKYPGWPKLPALEAMATELMEARETIAQLEAGRDALAKDVEFYEETNNLLGRERDRLGADAARMRLALEGVLSRGYNDDCLFCGFKDKHVMESLAPDDGWLARRIEEAVEPYRAALEEVTEEHRKAFEKPWCGDCHEDWPCATARARALLDAVRLMRANEYGAKDGFDQPICTVCGTDGLDEPHDPSSAPGSGQQRGPG